jgi:hypothetical protein
VTGLLHRRSFLIAACIAAISVGGVPATALATAPSRARYLAEADAICAAGSSALQAQRGALNQALTAYVSHDTAANRSTLSAALSKFFYTSWLELQRVNALPAPAGDRATLQKYLIGSAIVLSMAGPLLTAVSADLSAVVLKDASWIAHFTAVANVFAQSYGFFVCGSGSGSYEVRLVIKGARRIVPGTQVRLARLNESIGHAGEVLSATYSRGRTTALAVIRGSAAPLRNGAAVRVHGSGGSLYLTVLDGPTLGPMLGSGATLTGR